MRSSARVWPPGGLWGQSWDCRNILAMLAEAYGKGGQAEEGLRVLAEALAAVHKNAERHYEAELYRLKGELLLQQAVERGVRAVRSWKHR